MAEPPWAESTQPWGQTVTLGRALCPGWRFWIPPGEQESTDGSALSHSCGWAVGAQTAQRATKAPKSHLKHLKGFPSPHGRQVPHHHIQGLDGLKRDTRQPARESIVQSLQAHAGHPLYGHLKYPVLSFSWQCDLQLHLQQCQTTNQDDSFHWKGGNQEGQWIPLNGFQEAGVETKKSKDEATARNRYRLFLQLHLPKGVFQKPGVPPSWHLSPLWGNTGIWRRLYQQGGLSKDPINLISDPEHAPVHRCSCQLLHA